MHRDAAQTAKEALERLDQVQAGLGPLEAAAETGTLAGLVAHETRNLLTPAVAYAQLALRKGARAEDVRQALDRAFVAMRRACEVSELILAQLREGGAVEAPIARVSDVVADCVRMLGWDGAQRAFDLSLDVPSGAEAAIAPTALRHVILNLLLNARTALPAKGGCIGISLAQTGSTWNIAITDNGRGIEPTKLKKIKSNLGSRSPDRAGARHAGLGLVLCNRLLSESGGELRIDSAEASGTTATIQLRSAA